MIKKLKQMVVASLALALFATPLAMVTSVHAEAKLQDGLCEGANLQISANPDGSCAVNGDVATNTVNSTITLALNLFSAVVGIIAVVMIIVGGIKYITSGGDAGNVTSAKNTILYAVIGLVVVALAQVIVKFVLSRFTGSAGA